MEGWPAWLQDADEWLFLKINGFLHRGDSEAVENFLRFTNALGTWPAAVLLLALVALVGRGAGARVRRFCEVGLAAGFAFAGSQLVKDLISRPRPRIALESAFFDGRCFAAFEEILRSRSFPSGHTTTGFALATLLAVWSRALEGPWTRTVAVVLCFTFATLVGIARIYAGAHFPVDVLGGALLGAASAGLALWIVSALAGPRGAAPPAPAPDPAPS
jgi:undecaprenyl-diphosphatase